MNTWLFLLALAALILAPNNPVGLVILFIIACVKVWRLHDLETESGDTPGGDSDSPIDSESISRNCELT